MYRTASGVTAFVILVILMASTVVAERPGPVSTPTEPLQTKPASSVEEARARARILHEAFHGALQVMHRDFFDEDNARVLPSGSLEDVFLELQRSYGIEIRWLAVNAKAMNVNHEPQDGFERSAVRALQSGKEEYEELLAGQYRHVGSIRLASQCLKCHLPHRTSTKDRAAGLSIRMRVESRPENKVD